VTLFSQTRLFGVTVCAAQTYRSQHCHFIKCDAIWDAATVKSGPEPTLTLDQNLADAGCFLSSVFYLKPGKHGFIKNKRAVLGHFEHLFGMFYTLGSFL